MPLAKVKKLARDIPPLRAPYASPDEIIARTLLAARHVRIMPRRASISARDDWWAQFAAVPEVSGAWRISCTPMHCPRRKDLR